MLSPFGLIARIAALPACLLVAAQGPALAQQQAAPAQPQAQQPTNIPPPSAAPVPGEMDLAKLIWSTMVTIDNANGSGNYTVLRDSSATGFQIANDPAKLAQIFAGLRASRTSSLLPSATS